MENPKLENQTIKPSEMKIFQLTQKNFDSLGVTPKLSLQPYPFNEKILIGFFILGLFFICSLMSTIFESKTFTDYTQSVYLDSLAVVISSVLVILVFNVKKLFKLIDDCENLVNASEYLLRATWSFRATVSGHW